MALSDTAHVSPTTMASLDNLVDDVLIQIFQVLPIFTILSLRQTSRRYHALSKLRSIWHARFCADVLARNLPLPGPLGPLSQLSATELERRTLRALYLEQAWPRLSANAFVSKQHHHGTNVRVDQVVFIPGGTELLTVQGDRVVHWLIVTWPGFTQGLKRVGEWTPIEGVRCRIVKDGNMPGVIAVGPREPLRSQRFAKVLSTSLKAPFVTLCDYARVPGLVVGVWSHFLLLDTTSEPGGGGMELLDWHAQTTGTALLPRFPDLFGNYLDFVVFAGHLLVVWEHCVTVFPVPRVPADGQIVVEPKRVYMFQEAINRPVGFTTCVAPPCLDIEVDVDERAGWDMDSDWDKQPKRCASSALGMPPTLTIAAQSRRRPGSVSMVMLIPLVDEEGYERAATAEMTVFPYRLAYLPPHVPSWRPVNHVDDTVTRMDDYECTVLCLGRSGRGVFVVGRELRLVSAGLLFLPPYEMQYGPAFETGEAIYTVDRHLQQWRDLNLLRPDGDANVHDVDELGSAARGDKVDFDEGMGRFVVARERGGFEVVQLD